MRALSQRRGQTIDIQIGFNVYLDVPQEMRSRLWLVVLKEPSLAVPFQVCITVVVLFDVLCHFLCCNGLPQLCILVCKVGGSILERSRSTYPKASKVTCDVWLAGAGSVS